MTMYQTSRKKRCFLLTALLIAASSTALVVCPANAQTLPGVYTNSWLGNDFGMPDDHIAHTITNISVTPSGKVATVAGWDEGGTNAALYSATGAKIGIIQNGTGSWGRNSGYAIFADDNYAYHTMTQDAWSSTDPNGIKYPPNTATYWSCIRRYNHDGTPAPFTGGNGYDNSMLLVYSGTKADAPTGVVVLNNELYVTDPNTGQVKVYNASTMSQTPVRSFSIANVGLLDYDRFGFLWMLDTVQKKLIRFSKTGAIQSQSITFPSNVTATSFCVDKVKDRILVTNNGAAQNVLIYTNIFKTPSQTSTFGNTGGINSGVAGAIAPLKFSEPKGVGIDSAGNIFVGNNSPGNGGARLEKYNSSGTLQWRLNGLLFTSNGDLNPSDETEFYTQDFKFKLNLNNTTPGSEWSPAAQTLNKVKYPGDIRIPPAAGTTVTRPYGEFWTTGYTRIIAGKKLLFTSTMFGSAIGIHRFNAATDGETAIPSGWMTNKANIWRDANGNGSQDSGELETFGVQESPHGCFFFPDSTGGIWKTNPPYTNSPSLRYFPMQGFDAYGNPKYSFATSVGYTLPEIYEVFRVEYDTENDVMYATGGSASGALGGDWGVAGNKMVRYNNFRNNSTRTVAWSIALPFSEPESTRNLNVKAIAQAGDYLFLIAYRDGRIYVHKKSDGSKVGEIMPTADTGNFSGWTDITGAIRATKRSNGEYLIFAEENGKAKIMMYRWDPTAVPLPDSSAYSGVISLPAKVEAENFNTGGQNVAYNDSYAANQGGQYRTSEGVDIETTSDMGGGYNVGWMNSGEWMKYAVNVASAGTYNLTVRVASASSGGTMHIEFGGVNMTGNITVPNSGGWQTWQDVTINNISLAAGAQTMRVVMDSGGFNLNYVQVSATTPPPSPTNLLTNSSFDAEAFDTQTPSGWSEWEATGAATSSYTETNLGANSGARHGTHWNTAAYQVYTYQTKTGLANGLYTLKGYFKRGGNQTACKFEAKDFGSTTKDYWIPVLSAWTPVEIKDINVTNGQCTVGIWSDANAENWLFFDDVEFFKQ